VEVRNRGIKVNDLAGDKEPLKRELKTNREKVARLEKDTQEALYDLGRHLANLRLDGGYAELRDLIEKTDNLRASLKETEQELAYASKLGKEYKSFRKELVDTRREAKRLFKTVEKQVTEIGKRSHEAYPHMKNPGRFRSYFEDASPEDGGGAPGSSESEDDPRNGILGRLRSLRRVLDPRAEERREAEWRKNRYPRVGWQLLKTDFDKSVDGKLRGLFETVRKNLVSLLELERHQKNREEGLTAFDREMKEEWGYPDINAMQKDLERQRAEMTENMDRLYLNIGDIFNKHRLHNYVEDSFVTACRARIKRYHVRINELKLRQKDILLELKKESASGEAP